jgi:hypothetical protein
LALYIDSDAVREQYASPWMVWPLAPIVLYMTMRVWILARRDELHDDPVVFIVSDWRSQLMAVIGALLLVHSIAGGAMTHGAASLWARQPSKSIISWRQRSDRTRLEASKR